MAELGALTPIQRRRRGEIESLIRLAEPGLNLLLAVGDRVTRMIEPEDHDYYPPRPSKLPPPAGSEPGEERTES